METECFRTNKINKLLIIKQQPGPPVILSHVTKKNMTTTTKKRAGTEGVEFKEFFIDELKDIYWAEKHLVKALPKMKKAATSQELAAVFEKHTGETQTHIETLEKA